MNWKNLSYTKKGGIIGLIILIFLQLNQWFISSKICLRLIDPSQLLNLGGTNCSEFSFFGFLIFLPISLIIAFIVGSLPGALIGFFYGKINPENNPFRMWGGWVLGIIGLLNQFRDRIDLSGSRLLDNLLVFIFFFLVGWGVHLLIKKIINKFSTQKNVAFRKSLSNNSLNNSQQQLA